MEKEKVNIDNLKFIRVLSTRTGSEKVASTVATFLNEYSTGRLFRRAIGGFGYLLVAFGSLKVLVTKTVSEKVASTVATFLN